MEQRRHDSLASLCILLMILAAALLLFPRQSRGADTLPAQLTDSEFWRLVTDLSEPDGAFPYENFVSNERQYQDVIAEMIQTAPANGVYLGVAPEQNFTYIAALKPRMAFVIDIRRQNMIEILICRSDECVAGNISGTVVPVI